MAEVRAPAVVDVDPKDLPAYCPNPRMPLWSSHPRVFLVFDDREAMCPYCGTRYRIVCPPPSVASLRFPPRG